MSEDWLDIAKTISDNRPKPGGYTLSAGETLGQYHILGPLGRGGMGEVYEAENTITRKNYALKVLSREATGGTFVDRFRVEARVMQDLRHPHIVQVHHAGEEGGLYYRTMDLVTGRGGELESLEDLCSSAGPPAEGMDEKSPATERRSYSVPRR